MNFPPRRIPPLGAPKPTARQRALSEWRGIDLAPVEAGQGLPSQPIAELMPRGLNKLGLDRRRAQAEIVRVWNHLLDPHITPHAQPTRLHKGTLFLIFGSRVWLSGILP